jgi:hypothetical protein
MPANLKVDMFKRRIALEGWMKVNPISIELINVWDATIPSITIYYTKKLVPATRQRIWLTRRIVINVASRKAYINTITISCKNSYKKTRSTCDFHSQRFDVYINQKSYQVFKKFPYLQFLEIAALARTISVLRK